MLSVRRTRWPVAGAFAWQGAVYGSLAVAVLDLQRSLGFGPGGVGALLAVGFGGGACAALVGGRWVETVGPRRGVRRGLVCAALSLAVAAAAPGTIPLAAALVLRLAAAGPLAAAMNASAALITAGAPAAFMRFHAWFSGGAFVGAVVTAAVENVDVSWRAVWLALAIVGGLLALTLVHGPGDEPAFGRGPAERSRSVLGVLRSPALGRTALLLFAAVVAAGAVDTWGVRYLRVARGATVVGGAGAYAAGQLVAVAARARVRSSERADRVLTVPLTAGMVAAGLGLEIAAPSAWASGVGLAVAAIAAALVVPLLLVSGGSGDRPAAGVAAVGAVGQLGLVAGPLVVGTMTTEVGSGPGLALAAAFALLAAAGASCWRAVDARSAVSDCESEMGANRAGS